MGGAMAMANIEDKRSRKLLDRPRIELDLVPME
jgi:hypothetical protein